MRHFALASLLWLSLLGCSRSPNPAFFALAPQPGASFRTPALRVALRRPSLPRYLDRPQIVRRTSAERLDLSGNDRWASPLDDMIEATLAEDLAERLPSCHVYPEGGAISVTADALVEVDLARFEATGDRVALVAEVAIHWPATPGAARLMRYELESTAADGETPGVVTAMSALLARLSDAVARTILNGPTASAHE